MFKRLKAHAITTSSVAATATTGRVSVASKPPAPSLVATAAAAICGCTDRRTAVRASSWRSTPAAAVRGSDLLPAGTKACAGAAQATRSAITDLFDIDRDAMVKMLGNGGATPAD